MNQLQICCDMWFTIVARTTAADQHSPAFGKGQKLAGSVGKQDDNLGAVRRRDIHHIAAASDEDAPLVIKFRAKDTSGIDLIFSPGYRYFFHT